MINRCLVGSFKNILNSRPGFSSTTRFSIPTQPISSKSITLQHINNSKSIKELILDLDIMRLNQRKFFRQFIYRFTELLEKQALSDEQVLNKFQDVIYEIRRYSSAELHANASDILNYALLFKKTKEILPDSYRSEGFEHRASIVAENIPKIISLEGTNPKGIGLLHYFSITSNFSKVQLKKNIHEYLIRYYTHLSENNHLSIEIDLPLIILSISDFTKNKIPIESEIYENCISNIARRWRYYRSPLNIYQLFNKRSSNYIEQPLGVKLTRQQLGLKPSTCVNSKQNLVKICDLLCKILKIQSVFRVNDDTSYQVTANLTNYMILLFKVSKEMEIQVQTSQGSKETVKLWKMAKEIMKSIELCSQKLLNIDKLSSVILGEVLAFYQTDQLTALKRNKIIRDNAKEILEILYSCSEETINSDYSARLQQSPKKVCYSLISEITKKMPKDQNHCDDILETLVNMYRSRVKILSTNQWEKIFRQIIKQDENCKFWKIYYLIGQSKNPKMLKLIKLDTFIERVLKKKVFLIEKEKKTEFFNEVSNSNPQDNAARRELIYEINYYESDLLRTYGLALLTGNMPMLQKYGLLDEALGLLKKWVVPYNKFLISQLTKTEGLEKKFVISKIQTMPFAFIGKFCKIMFDETLCYHQQELVYQLLKMQQIKVWFLKNHNYKEINFFYYFKILLLGLNDPTHKKQIQQIYPLQTFEGYQLRRTSFFQSKTLEIFNQIRSPEQMQYMLKIMIKFDAIHTGRDFFFLWNRKMRTKTLDKNDPVMIENWRTFNKMILHELLQNLKNPKNTSMSKRIRLAFIVHYLEYLGSERANIVDTGIIKQVQSVLFDVKYEFDRGPVIFNYYYAFSKMGLLDRRAEQKLLEKFQVPKTTILYYAIRQNLGYQFDELAKTFNSSFTKFNMNVNTIKFALKYAQTAERLRELHQQLQKGFYKSLPSTRYQQLQKQFQKSCIRLNFKIEESTKRVTEHQAPNSKNSSIFRRRTSPKNHN